MPETVIWQESEVRGPHITNPIPVVVAKNSPYISNGNRLQNLSIYLPRTPRTLDLVESAATTLPVISSKSKSALPRIHVHVHGGAWRDPNLNSSSIEANVAHAFSDKTLPVNTVISINYTLSPFPTHPSLPYDPSKGNHSDAAREAVHPTHVHDIYRAFTLLRKMGLTDNSFILTGHSAGACLTFQTVLQSPDHWGFDDVSPAPRPAALIGMNGLYDLPALVHGLRSSHEHLRDVYQDLQSIAFGKDENVWMSASPALFDAKEIEKMVESDHAPALVIVDESTEDQLVPMNQADRMVAKLEEVKSMKVVRGKRCTGVHAAPWEQGYMIWENILDTLSLLREKN